MVYLSFINDLIVKCYQQAVEDKPKFISKHAECISVPDWFNG